jgi:deoxyhypusine synthase
MKNFINSNFKHFNSRILKDASNEWVNHLQNNGKMFLAMGGAMSTAEIGISLAKAIRNNKIHAISTTGANLEEDIFNLFANETYQQIDDWEHLTVDKEIQIENRVLDVCIPESVMRHVEEMILPLWLQAEENNRSYFPHEYFFQLLDTTPFKNLNVSNSWLAAAKEKNIPIYIPGWEDSTMGNILVSKVLRKKIKSFDIIKSGLDYMHHLVDWYSDTSQNHKMGFFQIGGGISGDFPICCVPLINQDLYDFEDYKIVDFWKYFCQISDGHKSYGSYSQAGPSEKITWGKLGVDSEMFSINSDATIVFPLIIEYILEK